jgi:hypothetical protein
MSSFNNLYEFRKKYQEFLNLLINKLPSKSEFLQKELIKTMEDDYLKNIADTFCDNIDLNKKYYNYLVDRRNKLFYKKSTVVIIKNISMKKVLERAEKKTSNKIWENLQLMYAVYRTGDKTKKDVIKKLIESVEINSLNVENKSSNKKSTPANNNDLIDDNSDDNNQKDNTKTAENMMSDITQSLRESFSNQKESGKKINPIENIIKISQTIGEKYKNKIENGELTLNDMMGSLQNIMKDIDVADDDKLNKLNENDFKSDPLINNLMSSGVDNMIKEMKNGNLDSVRRIMKDMNPEKILSSMPGLSGLSGSLGSMLGKKDGENKNDPKKFDDVPLTDNQLKELEDFYNKVETVKNKEESEKNDNKLEIEVLD